MGLSNCELLHKQSISYNRHYEISGKQENLDGYKIEQGLEIKPENVQNQTKKDENQVDFSIHETIEEKLKNEQIISYIYEKDLNLEENSSALDQASEKYTNTSANVSKALKSENEQFDVEGDVIKTELKVGNDSESKKVVCKRISAEHEVLNVGKTAKSVEIKSRNEEHQNENEENI